MDKKIIHFITYGDKNFLKAKQRILKEANEFAEFKTIKGYGPDELPINFKNKFAQILKQPRGGGYWIWKVAIIEEALKNINDGEFLIYMDAGCKFNLNGKQRFNEYIQLLNDSEYGVLSFQLTGNKGPGNFEKEKTWTTKQIFDYFNININSSMATDSQYMATILIFQKSTHCNLIIEKYIKALLDDPLLFTDYYNRTNQHLDFKDNRHDQSVLSLIRKIHGSVVIDDETWMQPFGKGESLKYPFWATRSKI